MQGDQPNPGREQRPQRFLKVILWTLALWFAAAGALVFGWLAPWSAIVNLALCRYFFIHMRWKGVLRGMGAPGFIAYWLAGAVCLLEVTRYWAPSVLSLALLALQIDFAVIMLSAGIYKFTAGYPKNHGMELGLCNPMWGYWWRWYSTKAPDSWVFWTLNQLGWSTEVIAAVLMMVPCGVGLYFYFKVIGKGAVNPASKKHQYKNRRVTIKVKYLPPVAV